MDTLDDMQAALLKFDGICRRQGWDKHHPETIHMLKDAYTAGLQVGHEKAAKLRRMLSGLEDGFLDVCKQRDTLRLELRLLKGETHAKD